MQNLEMDLPARYPRARRTPDGIGLWLSVAHNSVAWHAATVTVMLCDFHFVDYLVQRRGSITLTVIQDNNQVSFQVSRYPVNKLANGRPFANGLPQFSPFANVGHYRIGQKSDIIVAWDEATSGLISQSARGSCAIL